MIRISFVLFAMAIIAAPACGQQADTAQARLAGNDTWRTDFSRHSVPLHEIVSGGPPKDGIPAIHRPRFVSARAANRWLQNNEPVMVVEHEGTAKAYPLSILTWHEIVNDEVAGLPVSVTFCPLCNTAIVFDRRLEGRLLDFGTTGRLRHSDLVMYDRQTETWWQQATGDAIVGALVGKKLTWIASSTLAWSTARKLHPNIQVLSKETGHDRPYGRNPYVGYDAPTGAPLASFFGREPDPRLPAMERVVAIDLGPGWAAGFKQLSQARVVNDAEARTPFVVFWSPGAASALDEAEIAAGRDVGQTAVFDRRVADRVLTFQAVQGGFRDLETRSGWTIDGRAVDGPLKGQRLRAIPHGNHFWFAWVVFKPETRIWQP